MKTQWSVAALMWIGVAALGAAQPGDKQETGKLGLLFDKGFGGGDIHSMRFGLHLLTDQGKSSGKKLTYHAAGLTNNTCVRIDGKEYLLGHEPGKWRVKEAALGNGRGGVESVWVYAEGITVTQRAEIVRGDQTGLLDTCRVEYVLENESGQPHEVGIRFLLDTMIGDNDGAPFIVPGAAALMETSADYRPAAKVPAFVQALERMNFLKPGVIATLQFKVGGGVEAPDRVTLGGWPDKESKQPGARDGLTLWEVPVFSMKTMKDGAAVMYWSEQKLLPKQKRRVGFAYGLGALTADAKDGNLGLIVDGKPSVGQEITVIALLRDAAAGETLTLTLPKGLERVGGTAQTQVQNAVGEATWTVRPTEAGDFTLVVEAKSGVRVRKTLKIGPKIPMP